MKTARITQADELAAHGVVERGPGQWTVPSLSEQLEDGSGPVLRNVEATGNGRGALTFACDCTAGYMASKRVVCRHIRAVVAHLRAKADQ